MMDTLVLRNVVDAFPYSAGFKNKDSVFTHVNASYAKVVGLKQAGDAVGRTAYDMPAKTAQCASLFHEQDNMVMRAGKHMSIFGIHPDEQGNFKAYKFVKIPLRNEQNEVDGVFFTGEEISNKTTYELNMFIKRIPIKINGKLLTDNASYLVGTEHARIKISERNHEVLFYLLHGKGAEFIARVLDMPLKAVEQRVAELKTEFNALSPAELIDKALEMGFFHVLPSSVFNTQIATALNQD